MYFHSETTIPIRTTEKDQDSEDETIPQWMRVKTIQVTFFSRIYNLTFKETRAIFCRNLSCLQELAEPSVFHKDVPKNVTYNRYHDISAHVTTYVAFMASCYF